MSIPKIGRYDVIGELGRGAMGIVYQGRDPAIDRLVAIKTVRQDVADATGDRGELLKRFRREAQTAGNLSHPNIVTIYELGQEGDMVFLAMEYVAGPTLEEVMGRGERLPLSLVVHIISQVCDALDYAHEYDIVHRDVKPANVMLLEGYRVKVTDFGIAKVEDSNLTQSGALIGTPYYMAPEAFTGKRVDGRADLYGVGAILYELLTGERPYTGNSLPALMQRVLHTEALPPCTLDPTLPAGLDPILARALAKRPDDRYQTGAELVAELRPFAGPVGEFRNVKLQASGPRLGSPELTEVLGSAPGLAPTVVSYPGLGTRSVSRSDPTAATAMSDQGREVAPPAAAPEPAAVEAPPGMVRIPGGRYLIGTNTGPFGDGPEHEVELEAFYIDRFPVTNYQYRQYQPNHEYPRDQGDHPVTRVTWYEAQAYAESLGKRLATSAEWEAAARGRTSRRYPWGVEFLEFRCNVDSQGTVEVMHYPSGQTPDGVHDMAGNVWEWTQDWYASYPGSSAAGRIPARAYRTVRGGSWRTTSAQSTTTARHKLLPGTRADDVGFRCACDISAPS